MAKARYRFTFALRAEPEGGFTAQVPALPVCVTYGRTLQEAQEMAKDAISGLRSQLAQAQRTTAFPRDREELIGFLT
jgi:predicted RNase H-like HicB family nuclease